MEMKQSICDKDCFHRRFSDCINQYGPYTEAKDIKKGFDWTKEKPRPGWHQERGKQKHTIYIVNRNRRFVKWTYWNF